jgi:hypothetical protein
MISLRLSVLKLRRLLPRVDNMAINFMNKTYKATFSVRYTFD